MATTKKKKTTTRSKTQTAKRKPQAETAERRKPQADGARISRAAQAKSKALKQKNNNGKKPNKSKYKR